MRPKLLILLVLIVVAPLAALVALGAKLVHDESIMAQVRLKELLTARLTEVDASIQQALDEQARLVESQMPPELSPEGLREASRRSARVRQYFILDAAGELVYPSPNAPSNDRERAFFDRSRELWRNPLQVMAQPEAAAEQQQTTMRKGGVAVPGSGWFTWYWGSGIQFIHWWRAGDSTLGAEMNRTRLVADIIAALPQTSLGAAVADGRTVLLDSQASPVYQWGLYEPRAGEEPVVVMALSPPLSSWSLASYMPPNFTESRYGAGIGLALGAALLALALAMVGIAVYFYRENSRELREAGQRISFVNQVSHELKTPLTNIRLYAELLEQELEGAPENPKQYLHTIVAESQRLSRLIGNVLTFSRKGRNTLKLQRRTAVVDDVVATVVGHFEEPLRQKGIAIETRLAASTEVVLDPDALAQILGNLLSNVEKYAHGADRVTVATAREGKGIRVSVADNGPGIPRAERDRIFEPFYRISNRLTDGVAGTGIGLTIARDLARMHGGNLVLEPGASGATFVFTLHAEHADGVAPRLEQE